MYNIVVKAVVFKGNKVLILRRASYQKWNACEWDMPGGRLEEGEDPKKAIHREVFEEAGIKIKLGPINWRKRGALGNGFVWVFVFVLSILLYPSSPRNTRGRL